MKRVHILFTASLLLCAATLPSIALADEPPPAVQALLTTLERQTSIKPTYSELKSDGSTVTISNLTLAKPAAGTDPAMTLTFGEMKLSNISEQSPQLFQLGEADIANASITMASPDGSFKADVPQIKVEGWYVRTLTSEPKPLERFLGSALFAKHLTTGKITLDANGQSIVIDGAESTWDGDPLTGAGSFSAKVSNFEIPAPVLAMIDQGGMMKQLGYSSLNFDVTSAGEVGSTGEALSYKFDVGLTGRDIGALKIGAAVDGIPVAVYAAIMQAQATGKEPDFTALMPQIQSILINGASLRFEDNSIIKKVLPMAAAMQGMDEKTLVASIGPMVQLSLVQLGNEAFTKQVTEAVTAFFNDPKSLTLMMKPAAPLAVSDLMTMDPNNPAAAITKLGLSVTANQ